MFTIKLVTVDCGRAFFIFSNSLSHVSFEDCFYLNIITFSNSINFFFLLSKNINFIFHSTIDNIIIILLNVFIFLL